MKNSILEVKDLSKAFATDKGTFLAVNHVSFSLQEGECLGIIGESGSGKSTVANMIAGLLEPTEGELSFLGRTLNEKEAKANKLLRKEMQMVFQDPMKSFSPQMNLLTGVSESLRYYTDIPKKERRAQALEMIQRMGLSPEYAKRKCRQLSGGECQRAAIARAMLIEPKLLICDEVTSALDVSIQAQILQLLYQLKQDRQMSYLFISHDLALVSGFCDRIIVMYHGEIVESGTSKQIIHDPQEPYTKRLLSSVYTF